MKNLGILAATLVAFAMAGCTGGEGLHVTEPASIGAVVLTDAAVATADATAATSSTTASDAAVGDASTHDTGTASASATYPTSNIGGQPRTASKAGQIFPNLTLQGIRSAATLNTQATISMSEFYDPTGASYDLLHVIGIFMWCPHCNNETNNLTTIASWRAQHRVAVIEIAMEGYGSASPTLADVQKWVSSHNLDFPVVIDGQGAQLGKYFPVSSVPLNIVVNPRTMEILSVDIGEASDVQAYEQGFLNSL